MDVKTRLEALYPEMVKWRRHLHAHPELSFHEVNTAAFVAEKLESFGFEVRRGIGGHGVVAELRGERPGATVALRADIDALPIQDEKACAYASKMPGVMHACGHDAHTAGLLGAARVLTDMRSELRGTVRFLFQPAEEVSPGGAVGMIRDGAMDGVDAVYGVHLWSPFPAGRVYAAAGPAMAAADEFTIEIEGKGGHGGLPHQAIDSIVVGSHLVVNLQSIVSRSVDPTAPAVVSVGSLHAGTGFNVLADKCTLIGTVRTFDTSIRDLIRTRIEQIAAATCAMFGAKHRVDYKPGYPPVVNDAAETGRFFRVAAGLFGEERVEACPPIMAGEDFAYYLHKVPGCFVFVGAGNAERGITSPHHHPRFDIDETAMLQAAQLLIGLCLDRLEAGIN